MLIYGAHVWCVILEQDNDINHENLVVNTVFILWNLNTRDWLDTWYSVPRAHTTSFPTWCSPHHHASGYRIHWAKNDHSNSSSNYVKGTDSQRCKALKPKRDGYAHMYFVYTVHTSIQNKVQIIKWQAYRTIFNKKYVDSVHDHCTVYTFNNKKISLSSSKYPVF